MTIIEAIVKWAAEYRDRRFKLCVGGAILSVIGSLCVYLLTWGILQAILWFFTGLEGVLLGIAAVLGCLGLTLVYVVLDSAKLKQLIPTESRTLRVAMQPILLVGTAVSAFFTNQETYEWFVKTVSWSVMIAPALAMHGLVLAREAQRVQQLDPEFVAPFLIQLAKAGKRVPLEKLAEKLEDHTIADLIEQLSLIDGVIIRTEGKAGMYLTDPLQETLKQVRDNRTSSERQHEVKE